MRSPEISVPLATSKYSVFVLTMGECSSMICEGAVAGGRCQDETEICERGSTNLLVVDHGRNQQVDVSIYPRFQLLIRMVRTQDRWYDIEYS